MKSITATCLLTSLSSLATLSSFVSAQGAQRTITTDEAGQIFVGFPSSGGPLSVGGDPDTWTIDFNGPDEFNFTDSYGFRVECTGGHGQPCLASPQGDIFVVITTNPETGAQSISQRQVDGGLYWTAVGDRISLYRQGELSGQEFYFHEP